MRKVFFTLLCCVLVFGIAPAQGIGFYGIGGGVGFVNVSVPGESQSGIGFNGRVDLGELTTNLRLVPEFNYWSVSESEEGFSWKWSDFAINANVQYQFDVDGNITPFVGGGLGLNIVSVSIPNFFGAGSASSSTTEIGLNFLGGAVMSLDGPISPYAEFRYVILSNMNHLMIQAGIMYNL